MSSSSSSSSSSSTSTSSMTIITLVKFSSIVCRIDAQISIFLSSYILR